MARRTTVGVDETGRGSCVGPVVTCAVAFRPGGPSQALADRLGDSKALSGRRRAEAAAMLEAEARFAFGAASAREVDSLNPLRATMLAMARAVGRLGVADPYVIVDGPYFPDGLGCPGEAVVRADGTVPEVMAASILAKVFRDRLIARLAGRLPGYGLERHAGYGTKAHFDAVRVLGASPHHRVTFLRKALATPPPGGSPLVAGHREVDEDGVVVAGRLGGRVPHDLAPGDGD